MIALRSVVYVGMSFGSRPQRLRHSFVPYWTFCIVRLCSSCAVQTKTVRATHEQLGRADVAVDGVERGDVERAEALGDLQDARVAVVERRDELRGCAAEVLLEVDGSCSGQQGSSRSGRTLREELGLSASQLVGDHLGAAAESAQSRGGSRTSRPRSC